jgi:hypothetical protein
MKPTPIDPESIKSEAQKAAWIYDDINAACPHPFGSKQANIFKAAFEAAKKSMAEQAAKPATGPLINKLAGTYTPTTGYQRNNGNPQQVCSRGVRC